MNPPPPTAPFFNPQRLFDVQRLIDDLARNEKFSQRSDKGLTGVLGPPASADHWATIVEEHPQFFENVGGDYPLVLRRRYRQSGRLPLNEEQISRLLAEVTSYAQVAQQTVEENAERGPKVSSAAVGPQHDFSKVFIVHGHDSGVRNTVARFIENLGFEAITLRDRPNRGRTIITKFREEAAGAAFAVVLMTPDDVGKAKDAAELIPRARQNVVFELGFFIGVLGHEHVAAIVSGNVERPSDFEGVAYLSFDNGKEWQMELGRELRAAGYAVDWNKVMK